jgi:hypothetical protein
LPLSILFIALTKNEEQIRNENIKNKYGILFEGIKLKYTL